MRIWVFGRGYPTKENNLFGIFEFEQAQMLARNGHEVYYPAVVLESLRRWKSFGVETKDINGVHVMILHLPLGRLALMRIRRGLRISLQNRLCETLLRRYGLPDVIHVHYPSGYPYGFFAKMQKKGAKIVATEHWSKVQDLSLDPKEVGYLKDYTEHCDKLCCVSGALAKSIRQLTGTEREIEIVPNIISNGFAEATGQEHADFRFLSAGRLVPGKQFDQIASAFITAFRDDTRVTLTIAGMGQEYDKVASIVKEAGMENRIHLPGTVSRQEMAVQMASADALIVFSWLETFCVPVIEAWACGKPVIATETTVLADHPDDRLGIMVDCGDQGTLVKALQTIYHTHQRYDADWIKNYAMSHFSEEAVYRCLERIYFSALGR